MGNDVFANGREISCKSADGKSICAFPDVCFTPPENPATPPGVPIPYPNTGVATDTTSGSTTVKISGKEVMLKNKSYFKQSTGDEAGCAAKKGVVTSVNRGKVYFTSWSMDVKFEGENVVRHLDLTTHNHPSSTANTGPWLYGDTTAFGTPSECKADTERMQRECEGSSSAPGASGRMHHVDCSQNCKDAMTCILVPKGLDKELCCEPDNTGHHMIEDHWVKGVAGFSMAQQTSGYDAAPCVCVSRKRSEGTHQETHNVQGVYEESFLPGGVNHDPNHPSFGFTYDQGVRATLNAHDATFGENGCSDGCIEAQLETFYGERDDRPLKRPEKRQPLGEEPRGQTLSNWGPSVSG